MIESLLKNCIKCRHGGFDLSRHGLDWDSRSWQFQKVGLNSWEILSSLNMDISTSLDITTVQCPEVSIFDMILIETLDVNNFKSMSQQLRNSRQFQKVGLDGQKILDHWNEDILTGFNITNALKTQFLTMSWSWKFPRGHLNSQEILDSWEILNSLSKDILISLAIPNALKSWLLKWSWSRVFILTVSTVKKFLTVSKRRSRHFEKSRLWSQLLLTVETSKLNQTSREQSYL
jgi:hypothetical protein